MPNTDNSHGELEDGIELLLSQQKMLDVQDKMTQHTKKYSAINEELSRLLKETDESDNSEQAAKNRQAIAELVIKATDLEKSYDKLITAYHRMMNEYYVRSSEVITNLQKLTDSQE